MTAFTRTDSDLLIDTNTLLRSVGPGAASDAIAGLLRRGEELQIVPQNLFEFWVVATRPRLQNGFGFDSMDAQTELARIKSLFVLLPDTDAIYPAWEALVFRYNVIGKPAHDARLVAAMQVHAITSILTFDRTGFSRFPGIEVVHPAEIASSF